MPVYRKIIDFTPSGETKTIPLSQAVQVNNTIYVSGQIGLDPSTKALVSGGVEVEAKQALKNMEQVLTAAGSSMRHVVKCIMLLDDLNNFDKANKVYKQFFTDNHPARMCYQVSKLPLGAKVEIDAVAIVGDVIDLKAKL